MTVTSNSPIYLDHNATTPVLPEVVDAMLPFLRDFFGNPSSGHAYGAQTARALGEARAQVAALLGCDAEEVLFTSGGTEANNLAIRGTLEAIEGRSAVVTSVIEHPATARPCDWLEARGAVVTRLRVDSHGQVELTQARDAIDERTALISVMHANNETGALQPIGALARMGHQVGALIHSDAAQSVGKVPVRVRDLDVDLLSVAGHKLYAPKGVGALYVRRGTPLAPFTLGAGHERGLRPGTENLASIVGLGVACDIALRDLDATAARTKRLRDLLHRRLKEGVPALTLHGPPEARLPNTLNVRFPGVTGDSVLRGAPEIAASTGSACHAGQTTASAVILAMGVPAKDALGAVRLTLGRHTGEEDVERAARGLIRAWQAVRPPS